MSHTPSISANDNHCKTHLGRGAGLPARRQAQRPSAPVAPALRTCVVRESARASACACIRVSCARACTHDSAPKIRPCPVAYRLSGTRAAEARYAAAVERRLANVQPASPAACRAQEPQRRGIRLPLSEPVADVPGRGAPPRHDPALMGLEKIRRT